MTGPKTSDKTQAEAMRRIQEAGSKADREERKTRHHIGGYHRMIENTMVSGYGKPDETRIYVTKDIFDDYIPDPVYRCERCKDKLRADTIVYEWGDDWLCEDCIDDAVMSLDPKDWAEMTGESVAYTRQMVEMADTYEKLADLMRLEKAEAWSVL